METTGQGNNPPVSEEELQTGTEDNGPPPKVVRVDELETSIEKIVERSLVKAAQGQKQSLGEASITQTSAGGK